MPAETDTPLDGIAIVGMAGRFPGAPDIDAFWRVLTEGRETITTFDRSTLPAEEPANDADYVPRRGILEKPEWFDAAFFNIAPREAEVMDPQQRVFLELAWHALENAGCDPQQFAGSIGVFAGMSNNSWLQHRVLPNRELRQQVGYENAMICNEKDYLATRTAYKLNLRGPALNIYTACSTSLVAVCQAVQALQSFQCDAALAGGISIKWPQERGFTAQEGSIYSPDGHCRPYDAAATGTVFSNGAGVVVLKRLEDAVRDGDHIWAVIKGAALNNDGADKVSFTAPSVDGHAEVISLAYALAGFEPDTIGYVEGHGTATPIGDPIEVAGLTKAFRQGTERTNFCGLGSLKSNTGHMDAASGVAGLIKATLAVHHAKLPPTLHFKSPNPALMLETTPFFVVDKLQDWKSNGPRRAGVSSFGVGGTNAHVALEQAPATVAQASSLCGVSAGFQPAEASAGWKPAQNVTARMAVLPLSARSPAALDSICENLAAWLETQDARLADVAWTLQTGRRSFPHRRVIVAANKLEAIAHLRAKAAAVKQDRSNVPVVFIFPGQGAQHLRMGAGTYAAEPVFREAFDQCADLFASHGIDLHALLKVAGAASPQSEDSGLEARATDAAALNETRHTQPALFAVEYALAVLLTSWGFKPAGMLGHSIGEYVAATLAGTFFLEDAVKLVAARGRIMFAQPAGSMLAVRLPEAEVAAKLPATLDIATINGPGNTVVAGPTDDITAFAAVLEKDGISATVLKTSHAFHSRMMDGALEEFRAAFEGITLREPETPWISNVSGKTITAADATSPDYWVRHLRNAVRFADGIAALTAEGPCVFIEYGPGTSFAPLIRQHPAAKDCECVSLFPPAKDEGTGEHRVLLAGIGRLWMAGVTIDWKALHSGPRSKVPLPGYPFERQRFCPDVALPAGTQRDGEGWLIYPDTMAGDLSRPSGAEQNLVGGISGGSASLHHRLISDGPPGLQSISASRAAAVTGSAGDNAIGPAPGGSTEISRWCSEERAERPDTGQQKPQAPEGRQNLTRAAHLTEEIRSILHRASGLDISMADPSAEFLDLGFDSLFLTQASLALKKHFGVKITFRQLMEQQHSMAALAAWLDEKLPAGQFMPAAVAWASCPPATDRGQDAPAASTPAAGSVEDRLARIEAALGGLTGDAPPQPSPANGTEAFTVRVKEQTGSGEKKIAFGPFRPMEKTPAGSLTPQQQAHLDKLIADYVARYPKTRAFTAEHRPVFADPRAVGGFNPLWKEMVFPAVTDRSEGAYLHDIDGHQWIDVVHGFGSGFFGHKPPFVVEAIKEQLDRGYEIGPTCPIAGEVAKLVCEFSGKDRVAFCNTGSEALMAAIRVSRTITGRDRIAMFAGAYHGIFDEVLARPLVSNGELRTIPIAPGIPESAQASIIVLEYGHPESLEIIKRHAHEIAAVLVEPVPSRRPDIAPVEFVQELRRITADAGTALVFDEVVLGFRTHPKGAQHLFGISADLVSYGKVIGGGMPLGVLAGTSRFMDALDGGQWQYGDDSAPEVGVTFFAGTFIRHPLTMAAARAVLHRLKAEGPALQADNDAKAARFVDKLNGLFAELGVPVVVSRYSSLWMLHPEPSLKHFSLLFYHLRLRGVHIWEGRGNFVSLAHTEADLEKVLAAFRESILALQAGGFLPGGAPQPVVVPTTPAQREMFLQSQLSADASLACHESLTLKLTGPVDAERVARVLEQIAGRHDALRGSFSADGMMMTVAAKAAWPLRVVDSAAEQCAEEDFLKPFDLSTGPLVRATLVRGPAAVDCSNLLEPSAAATRRRESGSANGDNFHHRNGANGTAPERTGVKPRQQVAAAERLRQVSAVQGGSAALILTAHHIVCDGWSFGVVVEEFCRLYAEEGGAAGPAASYASYAVEDAERRKSPEHAEQLAWWRNKFTSVPAPLALPADRPRAAAPRYESAMTHRDLPAQLTARLHQFCAERKVTPYHVALAAFRVLVGRLSGQNEFVIGTPSAAQISRDLPDLVGHCVQFLPLRLSHAAEDTGETLLASTRNEVLDSSENDGVTFGEVLEQLPQLSAAARRGLVPVSFSFETMPQPVSFAGISGTVEMNAKRRLSFEASFYVQHSDAAIRLVCAWQTALFDEATIERWLGHYCTVLDALISAPAAPVSRLPLLTAAERESLLHGFSSDVKVPANERCLHTWFEDIAAKFQSRVAVNGGGMALTYAELNAQANRLAHRLRAMGVTRESLVGICLERTPLMLVAVLGILKAGGAYVPIDLSYPAERLAFMLEDAAAPVLVTQSSLEGRVPETKVRVVLVDEAYRPDMACEAHANPPCVNDKHDAAYVIYTSGSTGKPKGCVVTHHNVTRLMRGTEHWYGFGPEDVWTLFHSIAFDFSVWEIWGALLYGGRVVVVPFEVSRSPDEFRSLLSSENVTVLNQTPSAFRQLIRADERATTPLALHYVIFGGEALEMESLRPWFALHGDEKPRLVNMYGITETTVHVTYRALSMNDLAGGSVIGEPIPDLQVYVLDPVTLEPQPIGVCGEMYVGGDGLARGYLNRDTLTAERFPAMESWRGPLLHEDTIDGERRSPRRLYRTGDLARRLANGDLEYLGRIDHQVKIRGFRIELGEIESVLNTHAAVRESAVFPQMHNGEQRLVAWLVAKNTPPTHNELRAHLLAKLPDYMVPSAFVVMEKFPLTTNGKLDRAALPSPENAALAVAAETFIAPEGERETKLAAIWESVLGRNQIGRESDFFAVGGTSLNALSVMERVHREFGVKLPLGVMFESPRLSEFAARIEVAALEPASHSPITCIQPEGDGTPLFLLHGGDGGALFYRNLLPKLGRAHPVWVIESPAITDDAWLLARHSIESCAVEYLKLIRSVYPSGPVIVGGYSYGGVVAYELCQLLREQGGEAEMLLLFDTENPANGPREYSLTERIAAGWRLGGSGVGSKIKHLASRFSEGLRSKGKHDATVAEVRKLTDAGRVADTAELRTAQIHETHVDALNAWEPEFYDGPAVLFRTDAISDKYERTEDYNWRATTPSLKIVRVGGDHLVLFEEPWVSVLAEKLHLELDALRTEAATL